MRLPIISLVLISLEPFTSVSFTIKSSHISISNSIQKSILSSLLISNTNEPSITKVQNRKNFLNILSTTAPFLILNSSNALVKGNAPPPKKSPSSSERKCTNVEECQAMAEKAAQEEAEAAARDATPTYTTARGTRYKDISVGNSEKTVQTGDAVSIKYKVLKLGKRSYDGISGEGTVVFSRGFGLEDDDDKIKSFDFEVSNPQVIAALNDGIVGMQVNGVRRLAVLPQMGWRVPTRECDGGPGGSGTGGDLKTDYVVVPTATMVAQESCFDQKKLPFPGNYAEQRRMAQRFDQSLIMEIELLAFR